MTETKTRSIVKAITWRIIATLIAMYWVGFQAAIVLNLIQTVAYYFHERVWVHIDWGRVFNQKEIVEEGN